MRFIFDTIQNFLDSGGQVLWLILFTTLALWFFIFERWFFMKWSLPVAEKKALEDWQPYAKRNNQCNWDAHRIRNKILSCLRQEVNKNISMIKVLVALCPLLGLLGTVTGMIAVFDVMAISGTGNARMMASGISMATIPTMAGMVAALSGLYFGSALERRAKRKCEKFSENLSFH